MNGAQDLGGMMGFGPVAPDRNEPLFHADWERRVLALTVAAGATGGWSLDAMRFSRESLPPAEYLTSSYYEIWLKALAARLIADGYATPGELSDGVAATPARAVKRVLRGDEVRAALAKGFPYDREARGPAPFGVGERVRTKVMNPAGHTRLPRYARGKTGVVETVHGVHVFPDANAAGAGEQPQWLFSVSFDGAELWGPDAEPNTRVSVEAWESYLDPAV